MLYITPLLNGSKILLSNCTNIIDLQKKINHRYINPHNQDIVNQLFLCLTMDFVDANPCSGTFVLIETHVSQHIVTKLLTIFKLITSKPSSTQEKINDNVLGIIYDLLILPSLPTNSFNPSTDPPPTKDSLLQLIMSFTEEQRSIFAQQIRYLLGLCILVEMRDILPLPTSLRNQTNWRIFLDNLIEGSQVCSVIASWERAIRNQSINTFQYPNSKNLYKSFIPFTIQQPFLNLPIATMKQLFHFNESEKLSFPINSETFHDKYKSLYSSLLKHLNINDNCRHLFQPRAFVFPFVTQTTPDHITLQLAYVEYRRLPEILQQLNQVKHSNYFQLYHYLKFGLRPSPYTNFQQFNRELSNLPLQEIKLFEKRFALLKGILQGIQCLLIFYIEPQTSLRPMKTSMQMLGILNSLTKPLAVETPSFDTLNSDAKPLNKRFFFDLLASMITSEKIKAFSKNKAHFIDNYLAGIMPDTDTASDTDTLSEPLIISDHDLVTAISPINYNLAIAEGEERFNTKKFLNEVNTAGPCINLHPIRVSKPEGCASFSATQIISPTLHAPSCTVQSEPPQIILDNISNPICEVEITSSPYPLSSDLESPETREAPLAPPLFYPLKTTVKQKDVETDLLAEIDQKEFAHAASHITALPLKEYMKELLIQLLNINTRPSCTPSTNPIIPDKPLLSTLPVDQGDLIASLQSRIALNSRPQMEPFVAFKEAGQAAHMRTEIYEDHSDFLELRHFTPPRVISSAAKPMLNALNTPLAPPPSKKPRLLNLDDATLSCDSPIPLDSLTVDNNPETLSMMKPDSQLKDESEKNMYIKSPLLTFAPIYKSITTENSSKKASRKSQKASSKSASNSISRKKPSHKQALQQKVTQTNIPQPTSAFIASSSPAKYDHLPSSRGNSAKED